MDDVDGKHGQADSSQSHQSEQSPEGSGREAGEGFDKGSSRHGSFAVRELKKAWIAHYL
jgi:hypothetical protein